MSVLTAFWAVSLLFVITPGADWAYAISAGMRGRWVVPAVAGMLSGHLLVTLVVAAGVGSLIAGHPLALTLLTLAGCVEPVRHGGLGYADGPHKPDLILMKYAAALLLSLLALVAHAAQPGETLAPWTLLDHKLFAIPAMRDYSYRVLLDRNGRVASRYAGDEGKVLWLALDHGVVAARNSYADADALKAALDQAGR
ncbi:hypothetical protein WR25_26090 [Diploscapter pachys]|uniref:Uncharacterized protein n=1 Tax=Diploscapter pachys TaxID=2018661 RepID=A0A2A2K4T2_9BILA|nr:hypothetical protein WR25_26090 [Diploscapter pachys]